MYRLLILGVLGPACGCSSPATPPGGVSSGGGSDVSGRLSTPEAARVSVDDTLARFDAAAADVLVRYLAGNERW